MDDYRIIAVDFDGTLCYSNWPDTGEPNTTLIEYLKNWKAQGNKLILWTCRAGEALELAVSWCFEHHLEFDAINDKYENTPVAVMNIGDSKRARRIIEGTEEGRAILDVLEKYDFR